MRGVITVILGGGAGTRLFPLTLQRSKPAVPLAGKYRLIDIPISNCINSDLTRIFVLTQFNSASLNRHVAMAYRFDRFRRGFVHVLAAEQTPRSHEWFQGTADAVRQSLQHLSVHGHSEVLVLSGDQLYSMNYRKLVTHHREQGADITVATIPVSADEASGLGVMRTNDDGTISEFLEKPAAAQLPGLESRVPASMHKAGRVYLASMGIYVFAKHVLQELLADHPDANDFGKQIIPGALGSQRLVSYPFDGYWSDIGTIRSFYEANLMLAEDQPPFDMYNPRMPLYTNARMLAPAKIRNSRIERSIIAEASVLIDARITRSVVGLRSYVGEGAVLRNTVLMGADYYPWSDQATREVAAGPDRPGVGAGAHVENAIVDRNVSIGEGCVISNADGVEEADGDNYYIRDRIVVIPKNASIPPGTEI